jgi:hypothetical protein
MGRLYLASERTRRACRWLENLERSTGVVTTSAMALPR